MNNYGNLSMDINTISQQHTIPKIDPKAEDSKLREQTDAFESIMIKMVMDNAAKDEKNIFSTQNDPGDKVYKSMYREELSKVSAGGFGFSQMLYDFLSEKAK